MKHKIGRISALVFAAYVIFSAYASPVLSVEAVKPKQPIVAKAIAKKLKPKARPRIAITFRVTAYTGVDEGQRGDDITASGAKAIPYHTIATSKAYPFGTVLEDVETHKRYVVQDRGGAIKGFKIDLYVGHRNIREAMKFGVQTRKFYIIKRGQPRTNTIISTGSTHKLHGQAMNR